MLMVVVKTMKKQIIELKWKFVFPVIQLSFVDLIFIHRFKVKSVQPHHVCHDDFF